MATREGWKSRALGLIKRHSLAPCVLERFFLSRILVWMPVELTEALLSTSAGWEVMKRARAYLDQREVISSYWEPPLLRGVVQTGGASFRASMVIKSHIDMEN